MNETFATAASIGSVSANMFMSGSPFVLEGFVLENVSSNVLFDLHFTIKNIHGEPIKFRSILKWLISLV